MKNSQYELASWESNDQETTLILDIDWTVIRSLAGSDHIDWILGRPLTDCQMVLVKKPSLYALVVEFYREPVELEYCLRWAK
jgi:hypothetical protein